MQNILKKYNDIIFSIIIVIFSRIIFYLGKVTWNMIFNTHFGLMNLINQWDSGWYANIIENGYMLQPAAHLNGDAANWAFFPLYPMCVRLFKQIINLNTVKSGFIVSSIFLVISLYFIIKYLSLTRDKDNAITAAILVALGPYSFYFSCLYTESLFILLVILCFYYMQKENWILCGIFGALLSATRATGVLLFISLFIKIVTPYIREHRSIKYIIIEIIKDGKKLFGLILFPAGLFSYMTFLYFYMGDAFAFKHVEIAWGRTNSNPFKTLFYGLIGKGAFGGNISRYLAIWGVIGIIGSIYLFIHNKIEEGVFGFLCIIVPMMSNIQSLPRYFIGTLVLIFSFNDLLNKLKGYKWPVVALLCMSNILLLFLWYGGQTFMT